MWARAAWWSPSMELAPGQALQGDPACLALGLLELLGPQQLRQRGPGPPGDQLGPPVGAHRAGLPGEVAGLLPGPSTGVEALPGALGVAEQPGHDPEAGVGLAQRRCGSPPAPATTSVEDAVGHRRAGAGR